MTLQVGEARAERDATTIRPGDPPAPAAPIAPERTQAAAGTIRRRIGLPNGRAVAGGLLVTIAAMGGWLVATGGSDGPTTSYLTAARSFTAGEVLGPDDVVAVPLDLPLDQQRGTFVAADSELVAGSVTLGPIAAGSLLTDTTLSLAADPASDQPYREVSLALPAARAVNGSLRAGDRVDVVSTDAHRSVVLVQRARVLDVSSGGESVLGPGGDVTVTLAVEEPDEALAVAHGAAAEQVTLLRSTRADRDLPAAFSPDADPADAPPEAATSAAAADRRAPGSGG